MKAAGRKARVAADDRRDLAWYVDKAFQIIIFAAGVSAIVFIIGIFFFITQQGFGFISDPEKNSSIQSRTFLLSITTNKMQ